MRKSGQTQLLELVIEVIFAAAVILLAASYMFGQIGEGSFQRRFYARDTALVIDQIQAMPGQVEITYDATSQFAIGINVTNTSVLAHEINGTALPTKGIFATTPHITVENAWTTNETYTIRKNTSVNLSG